MNSLSAMGRPPEASESQKWEPTQSAVLGRSATHSESSRRSRAPRSTQSDGDRHPEPLWTSLTRKRSLVQIQYGPRFFRTRIRRKVTINCHLRGSVPVTRSDVPGPGRSDVNRLGLDRPGTLAVRPFQAAAGLRNVRSRKNGVETHS